MIEEWLIVIPGWLRIAILLPLDSSIFRFFDFGTSKKKEIYIIYRILDFGNFFFFSFPYFFVPSGVHYAYGWMDGYCTVPVRYSYSTVRYRYRYGGVVEG